jgi:hypothetical protein
MFDSFFCDHINGFDLYSENPEDDPLYSNCGSTASNPRYYDGVITMYDVYGLELQKTKKATLYQLVIKKKKDGFNYKYEYALGPEKWLPNSEISSTHISEFDATDVDFADEFAVTGIADLHKISIPGWLKSKDETLRTVFAIKNMRG